MAKPITSRSSQFILELGDGGSPETFSAPCGLTSKGINFTKTFNEQPVPDCDDPEAPAWIERATEALSSNFTGDGILSMGDFETWWNFNSSTASRNVRVTLDVDAPNAALGGHWAGKYLSSNMGVTAELGSKVAITIELQSDGEVIWVPAP